MFRSNPGEAKRGIGQMTKEDLKANEEARKAAGLQDAVLKIEKVELKDEKPAVSNIDLESFKYGGSKKFRKEPSSIEDPEAVRPHMFPRMNLADLPRRSQTENPPQSKPPVKDKRSNSAVPNKMGIS